MLRWSLQKNFLSGNVLFVVAVGVFSTFAAEDSLRMLRLELPRNVLIVKNESYLEGVVGALLMDSLSTRGFSVKFIPMEALKDEQPSGYRATIIMNAVQSSKLQGIVRSYARALGAERSNILICTVYGEEWNSGNTVSDAVSAATTTLAPAAIVVKIMHGFDAITARKKKGASE